MTRIIEGTIIFLIVLLLFFGAVIYFVPKLVDLNDYKSEISSFVQGKTGREFVIEGDVKLSLFPWVGADIGKIRLSNPEGFGKDPFLELEQAEVAVKFMPLMKKIIEVETLTVKGLNLNLVKNISGKTNWEDLVKPQKMESPKGKTASVPQKPSSAALPLAAFSAGGIIVENSNLTWTDNASGLEASIKNITLTTGAVKPGRPLDVDVSFDIESNRPNVSGFISLKTEVSLKEDFSLDRLVGTQVQSNLVLKNMETGQVTSLKNFDFKAGPIVLNKPVDLNVAFYLENNKPEINGNFVLKTVLALGNDHRNGSLTQTDLSMNATGGIIPGGKADLHFTGDVTVDLDSQYLSINPMKLTAYNVKATGGISGAGIIDDPSFKGKVTIDAFNVKEFMKSLAMAVPETADPEVLKKLGLIVNFAATKNSAEIPSFWAKLDETTIKGNASVKNFRKPSILYDLNLDAINVDSYLPPITENASSTSAAKKPVQKAAPKKPQLPLKTLRELDIAGTLKAKKVTARKADLTEVVVNLKAKGGVIKLHPVKMNVFQGSYAGDFTFDARKDVPVSAINTTLLKVNIGDALKTLANKNMLTGTGNVHSTLAFQGIEPEQIKRTLNGKAQFEFRDGQVNGFNIPAKIRQAKATLSLVSGNLIGALQGLASGDLTGAKGLGNAKKPQAEDEPMDFSEITASATISKGYVVNKDLQMKSPLLRLTGAGASSIPRETIDYLTKVKFVGSLEGQGGSDNLKGLTIPLRFTGTYAKPDWKIDTSGIKRDRSASKPSKGQAKKPVPKELQEMQKLLKQTPFKDLF